jgi:hypothetical protein
VLIHSWYLRRIFWSDDFEDIMAIIDDDEEYEKPDITKIVHALIIYALVVLVGGFLLIGLSHHQEQEATAIVRCK